MVRPSNFEIREQATEPTLELSVTGELDMNTVELLAKRLERYLAEGARAVRLDLAALGFMDSSGLRLLIDLYDRSRREGWELKIVRPRSDAAAMVLQATGADTALPFEPNGSP
jgi:stage II sporulation protein AA (anti-sigma F factor antagonist)